MPQLTSFPIDTVDAESLIDGVVEIYNGSIVPAVNAAESYAASAQSMLSQVQVLTSDLVENFQRYNIRSVSDITSNADLTYASGLVAGDVIYTMLDGMSYLVRAADAIGFHLVSAGGVKFSESGTKYTTLARYVEAYNRGDMSDVINGTVVSIGGEDFVRDTSRTWLPGFPGLRKGWMKQKHLLSSDWQPVDAAQVSRLRSVMDSITATHPDLTHAHILGDLVDAGSVDSTGAEPEYGFRHFLEDWRQRLPIPLSNAYFIPGNHDRDGIGGGVHRAAWSLQSYRKWIGREYYATLQGNLLMIYLGDMGGSNSGEISDAAFEWASRVIRSNLDKNILIHLHQPLSGTYASSAAAPTNYVTEASDAGAVQANSGRLLDLLAEVHASTGNNPVKAVFYGHVGSSNQFTTRALSGCVHAQIGMHIPGNVTNGRNDHYYVMRLEQSATGIPIQQWDATTGTLVTTKNFSLAYPLQLGPEMTHDGRSDEMEGPRLTPLRVMVPADETRATSAPFYPATPDPLWIASVGIEDRAYDSVFNGVKFGYGFSIPSAVLVPGTGTSGGSYFVNGGYVDTFGVYAEVIDTGADNIQSGKLVLQTLTSGNSEDMATLFPTASTSERGLKVEGGIRTGFAINVPNFGNGSDVGASLTPDGRILASTDNEFAALTLRRTGPTGSVVCSFYNSTAIRGSISFSGTSTVYTTTSDGRLKEDVTEFDGVSLVKKLRPVDFRWKTDGTREYGFIAQELVEVLPQAVKRGGEDAETDPWQVDPSKVVPALVSALQQALARIEALERNT